MRVRRRESFYEGRLSPHDKVIGVAITDRWRLHVLQLDHAQLPNI
jgi:hypothetical protein